VRPLIDYADGRSRGAKSRRIAKSADFSKNFSTGQSPNAPCRQPSQDREARGVSPRIAGAIARFHGELRRAQPSGGFPLVSLSFPYGNSVLKPRMSLPCKKSDERQHSSSLALHEPDSMKTSGWDQGRPAPACQQLRGQGRSWMLRSENCRKKNSSARKFRCKLYSSVYRARLCKNPRRRNRRVTAVI
jgi:hypothetical protein